jgi:hypothetical protein
MERAVIAAPAERRAVACGGQLQLPAGNAPEVRGESGHGERAQVGYSEPLAVQLRKEEVLGGARSKLAALAPAKKTPEARPDPAQVRRQFEELTTIIDQAPARAREAAHRLLTDITLTPRPSRTGRRSIRRPGA